MNGRTSSPSSILSNPSIIAFLEIRSYAPTPSMDTTVARLSKSVMVCKMWATHSHPAFVVKAYWKGAVASAFLATCFAIVLATRRRMTSPTTIPPHAPVWFPQSRQPSQSQPVQHLTLGWSPAPKLTLLGTTIRNRAHCPTWAGGGPLSSLKGLLPLPSLPSANR